MWKRSETACVAARTVLPSSRAQPMFLPQTDVRARPCAVYPTAPSGAQSVVEDVVAYLERRRDDFTTVSTGPGPARPTQDNGHD